MPTLAWNEKAHLKWATPKMGNAFANIGCGKRFLAVGCDHGSSLLLSC
jgi:hypothetical protein